MMNSSGGKGSGRRPSQVSREEIDNNWDRIFGKKEEIERDYQNVWVEGGDAVDTSPEVQNNWNES